MRCPYCIEGGHFKVMIGQTGAEPWYMRSMRTSDLAEQSVL